jgi:hypothetical protein
MNCITVPDCYSKRPSSWLSAVHVVFPCPCPAIWKTSQQNLQSCPSVTLTSDKTLEHMVLFDFGGTASGTHSHRDCGLCLNGGSLLFGRHEGTYVYVAFTLTSLYEKVDTMLVHLRHDHEVLRLCINNIT